MDVRTGNERWKFEVEGAPNLPSIVDGRVFVGTNLGTVIAIGGTGAAASVSP